MKKQPDKLFHENFVQIHELVDGFHINVVIKKLQITLPQTLTKFLKNIVICSVMNLRV